MCGRKCHRAVMSFVKVKHPVCQNIFLKPKCKPLYYSSSQSAFSRILFLKCS